MLESRADFELFPEWLLETSEYGRKMSLSEEYRKHNPDLLFLTLFNAYKMDLSFSVN